MINCKTYNIHINDWNALREYISTGGYSKILVLVDENTKRACLPLLKSELKIDLEVISIASGEQEKNIHTCTHVWDKMLDLKADRHSLCINLGGGVIGDLGGFAAATYMRGMDFIQLPTTLLSQVDASVGGKLGVDFHMFKNLIGLIQNPGSVFIYTEFLHTLPYDQLRSGYAELLKHGLIADVKIFDRLSSIVSLESIDWAPIVEESVCIKKDITEEDPMERGIRKVLNFGHTLGHAIETLSYDTDLPFLHGEAVAIGMIMETHLSFLGGYISKEESQRVKSALLKLYGQHHDRVPPIEQLLPIMQKDKKNKSGQIKFTLLESLGSAIYDQVCPTDDIATAIQWYKD